MKFITYLAVTVFCTSSASAAFLDATKIDVLKNQRGSPAFGLQYSRRPRPVVAITFSVKGNQLVGTKASPIDPTYWAIVNKHTGVLVTPWSNTEFGGGYVTPDASEAFSFSIDGPPAAAVLNDMRKMALALSIKNTVADLKPTVYLDLDDLCNSAADGFIDLDHGRSGCPQ